MTTSATWCGNKFSAVYVKELSVADKRRYLEKTQDIGDPYAYALSTLDQEDLPPVRSLDIFNYLVLSTSFCTSDRFKAYKRMDAYKYFISGFVSSVAAKRIGKCYVVVGKVSLILVSVALLGYNILNETCYISCYVVSYFCYTL